MRHERLFTIPEAADQLGLYYKSVYRLVYAGHLRAVRVGPREVRIPHSAVREMLAARRAVTQWTPGVPRVKRSSPSYVPKPKVTPKKKYRPRKR